MLEPQEALQVYKELSGIARQVGLQWLLDDVERQIALGKEFPKEIQFEFNVQGHDAEFLSKRKGRSAKFIVTQPFSGREQLLLLIEAIEAASIGLTRGLVNPY
jgi:hypothetical protein